MASAYIRRMLDRAKALLRPLVPRGIRGWATRTRQAAQDRSVRNAEKAFLHAPRTPEWLSHADLERLCAEHPYTPSYGYDARSFERRGQERAANILKELPDPSLTEFLDLACMDGMTAAALQHRGKQCWGVDQEGKNFDPRARAAGVRLEEMDALALDLPNDRFDVVYSFNAFEHFADPAVALREALRVTKPGGYVYLHFGPLYGSAKGMHAYYQIPVPYCQFLFPLEMMNAYLREQGKPELDPNHCNGWPVQRYRDLWESVSDKAEVIAQAEFTYPDDLDLVVRYPSCFRNKTERFEDLVVNIIHIVFQKR